jgi:carboxypeptidase Taq
MTTLSDPIRHLRDHLLEVSTLSSVSQLVDWDQETYLPSSGAGFRAEQSSLLSRLVHERRTSAHAAELLSAAEGSTQAQDDPGIAAMIREAKRDFDRASKLPGDLVAELAETGSRAQEAWKHARAGNDFAAFQPWLEKMVTLSRRKAECYGTPTGGELYDALLDEYEPDAKAADIEAVFTPLRQRLSDLIKDIARQRHTPDTEHPARAHPRGEAGSLRPIRRRRLRLQLRSRATRRHRSPLLRGRRARRHPLTTRYREDSWTDALYGTMHEMGHGLYEQGLPLGEGTGGAHCPCSACRCGEAVSLGIHESQSRLWENAVGRSEAFWTWALPHVAALGRRVRRRPRAAPAAVNTATPSLIRVEADEGTYNLHVMIRFELERALISGDLST